MFMKYPILYFLIIIFKDSYSCVLLALLVIRQNMQHSSIKIAKPP